MSKCKHHYYRPIENDDGIVCEDCKLPLLTDDELNEMITPLLNLEYGVTDVNFDYMDNDSVVTMMFAFHIEMTYYEGDDNDPDDMPLWNAEYKSDHRSDCWDANPKRALARCFYQLLSEKFS